MSTLRVHVYDECVGMLHVGPKVRFVPEPLRTTRPDAPTLGWSFVADARVRESPSTRLPAWFDNLLPENGSALRRRVCEEHGLHESDDVRILAALSADLPGAVTLHGDVLDQEREPLVDPDDRDSVTAGRLRFSVAGMQPKLSMIRTGERWCLPGSDDTGARWYVKFAGPAFPELAAVECATMDWARASGLDVPEHRLVSIADVEGVDTEFHGGALSAFAVERFDRVQGARVHQEDFAQALEIYAHDKYGGTGRLAVSYDSLARLVADACGEDARSEFIQRVAFLVASGNDDGHLKNWSFQWCRGAARPRLSPCYDLVATVSWPQFGWGRTDGAQLALPLAGSTNLGSLDHARVHEFARRARAPGGTEVFLAALRRASGTWMALREGAPELMRAAIDEHWERVPILRAVA